MKIPSERSVLHVCNISGEELNNRVDKCILSALILFAYRSIYEVLIAAKINYFIENFPFQEIRFSVSTP
jgi:hypothetical protein